MTTVPEERVVRVLAWLIRNESVDPEAIERAVSSAREIRLGEMSALDGGEHPAMRRVFVWEQARRLQT